MLSYVHNFAVLFLLAFDVCFILSYSNFRDKVKSYGIVF